MERTERLWREFHERLREYIARRVKREADAGDVLQEVFLRIHRGLGSLRDSDRVVPWLFQVARRAIADHYRAQRRRRTVPLEAEPSTPEAEADAGRELSTCLRPMLKGLPDDYREAIELVEIEGLSQRAASEKLGLSFSGMKSRVQRGREKLKGILHECCHVRLDAGGKKISDYEIRNPASCPCDGKFRPSDLSTEGRKIRRTECSTGGRQAPDCG